MDNTNTKTDTKFEGKQYWLISAPKTNEDTFNTMNKKTSDEADLSVNYKLAVPDLKVGTLDSLMTLSDDLVKMDAHVENITRKISGQLFDVLEPKADKYENLAINNTTIDAYVSYFRWDEAKFPTSQSLKNLTEMIHSQVTKLDEELRAKASEYAGIQHSLNSEERKNAGTLATRDLSDVVQEKHIVKNSEYLVTIFVAVPKYNTNDWTGNYAKLAQCVVPESSELISEDNEYGLWSVTLFRKFVDEFKGAARERKFTVREYNIDDNKSKGGDKKKLEAEKDRLKKGLIRWCKTNFSEAFVAWIHLKAIRVFVESVLRYGLPTNFQAMLLLPNKGKQKRLRKVLHELYGYLSTKNVFSKDEEGGEQENEKFFPYVFLEVNLDLRKLGTF